MAHSEGIKPSGRFRRLTVMILAAVLAASLVQNAFHELDSMCARDRGRLWGVPLCGPTLLVDPNTRAVVANRPITMTTLPRSMTIANTSVEWNGVEWTMVQLPLPRDAYSRRVLLVHESFHRIASRLGFGGGREGGNAHLDTVEGRYWMQLEWRALAAALRGDARAIDDALAFRARRRQLFPNAAAEERDLEIREGLAEYTGTALAEPDRSKRIPHLVQQLRDAEKAPSFVRSFAYASGPVWGALLEKRDSQWTHHLKATDDLGDLLGHADAHDADARVERYGGAALLAAEKAREEKHRETVRELRRRLIDGPVLTLPLRNMRFEFDPNQAIPFEPYGTVYPALTVHDDWGTIVVNSPGGLISSDWTRLTVPADPAAYMLALNPGWVVVDGRVDKR